MPNLDFSNIAEVPDNTSPITGNELLFGAPSRVGLPKMFKFPFTTSSIINPVVSFFGVTTNRNNFTVSDGTVTNIKVVNDLVGIGTDSPDGAMTIEKNGVHNYAMLSLKNNSNTNADSMTINYTYGSGGSIVAASLSLYNNAVTNSGYIRKNRYSLVNNGDGGIALVASNVDGTISFYTGGGSNSNNAMKMFNSGRVSFGFGSGSYIDNGYQMEVNGVIKATSFVGNFSFANVTNGKMPIALNEPTITSIASSATMAIGAAGANTIEVTGSATITGFDSIASGAIRRLLFAGVLTLTNHNTSLQLPTSANIVTAVGDIAEFISLGSGNWKCINYVKKNGEALAGSLIPINATLASAATVNIGASVSTNIYITGTTTITSFGTIASGISRNLIFNGSLTLTHNGTSLILPTGANIVTAAGDSMKVISNGAGNWKCISYLRADGTALTYRRMVHEVRTINTPLVTADIGKLIERTAGNAQSLSLASSIGTHWDTYIKNSTGSSLTIMTSGADLIAGSGSLALANGNTLHLHCNGSTFTIVSQVANPVKRLHVLSTEASTCYSLGGMLPIFDKQVTGPNYVPTTKRMLWTGQQFIHAPNETSTYISTSPDGEVWTLRTIGTPPSGNTWFVHNNGGNVIAIANTSSPATYARVSSDHGLTWGTDILAWSGITPYTETCAYNNTGRFIMTSSAGTTDARHTIDNGTNWTSQTLPAAFSCIRVLGGTFIALTNANVTTYYTSTTGLTGSWTARTLPASLTRTGISGNLVSDGDGGVFIVPTDTTKNYWHTSDGINWTDLGFNKASYVYGGLGISGAGSVLGLPFRVNGNWVVFNYIPDNSNVGTGGAGALVKYADKAWVPMYMDVPRIFSNTDANAVLTVSNGSGKILVKSNTTQSQLAIIDTTSPRCMGSFIKG